MLNKYLTKRGVVWLGQTCNLRCYFCYFKDRINDNSHPEHQFMSLNKAKEILQILKDYYGNNAVDIQGGEPTIYPYIFELLKYANSIGIAPTLITNGIVLSNEEKVKQFKDSGVKDFLFSLHALGTTYDEIVGVKGASNHQLKQQIIDILKIEKRFFENVYILYLEFNTHTNKTNELLKLYLKVLWFEMKSPLLQKIKFSYKMIKEVYVK